MTSLDWLRGNSELLNISAIGRAIGYDNLHKVVEGKRKLPDKYVVKLDIVRAVISKG